MFNKFIVNACHKMVKKGTRVFLEGEIKTRGYDKDGEKRWITEIVVPNIVGQMIVLAKGKRHDDEPEDNNADWKKGYDRQAAIDSSGEFDDDIPF